MILKMSAVALVYVALTFIIWKKLKSKKINNKERIMIGLIFGCMSILSTHFGIDFGPSVLNLRDLGPMLAGLFFDPISGIFAGLIGGIERYIVGTYFNIGAYTRIACSVSTCMAGFLAAFFNILIFKGKKPSIVYGFYLGAFIEVFHMYSVFLTHHDDIETAFLVIRVCALPMIIFSGIGLSLSSMAIVISSREWENPLKRKATSEVPISRSFQNWLFIVTMAVFVANFAFSYSMQTQVAEDNTREKLASAAEDIKDIYPVYKENGAEASSIRRTVGEFGVFYIFDKGGRMISEKGLDAYRIHLLYTIADTHRNEKFFHTEVSDLGYWCRSEEMSDGELLLLAIFDEEAYKMRDIECYEMLFADILLFTIIYVLVSLLIQSIVVDNLRMVNESLDKITAGNLNEEVKVYKSSEFASLSSDINQTVQVLKGYIEAAEKRIESELLLAKTIQESSLPKNFDYNHSGFDLYATMDPAKEVGGDFYDFFFVDSEKLALVIADVSGKGIPASLFMMRSKTAIRSLAETGNSPAEALGRVNNELCDGNEANMFVTVWIGIIDLVTGDVACVNAGHEYPVLRRRDGDYEIYKDNHRLPLGAMEDMVYKEYNIHIEPGDCIYVYTDGVPEAINESEEQYGTDRLTEVLNRNKDEDLRDILHAVKKDIDEFAGEAEQFDDITMMGFRFNKYSEKKK